MALPAFNSAARIITFAMRNAGLLPADEEPDTDQYENGMFRLNDLVNFWQTNGLKLWLQYDLPVPLTAGVATYSIGPGGSVNMTKPTRVIDSNYYIDSSSNRRPIDLISRDEYSKLSNVVTQGQINSVWVDKQQLQLVANPWMVPDTTAATGVMHLCIQQQVTNLVNITDTMNFPQEWFLALHWGLADDMCTGQPSAIMDRCATKAIMYFTALENWDVEDASTTFAVDSRGSMNRGFR